MGYSVITTVLLPADSHDLIDLPTVKTELSIGASDTANDAWLAKAITQVSKSIERYCKRVFAFEQLQDAFDIEQDPYPWQTPGGFPLLALTRWPVSSIGPVDQTLSAGSASCAPGMTPGWRPNTRRLVPGQDFRLNMGTGEMLRIDASTGAGTLWEALPVTVTYEAGYNEPPEDLVEICLRLITARFRSRGRDPNLMMQDMPGMGPQRWWVGGAPGQSGPFPPDIAAALDDYRVPTVA